MCTERRIRAKPMLNHCYQVRSQTTLIISKTYSLRGFYHVFSIYSVVFWVDNRYRHLSLGETFPPWAVITSSNMSHSELIRAAQVKVTLITSLMCRRTGHGKMESNPNVIHKMAFVLIDQ